MDGPKMVGLYSSGPNIIGAMATSVKKFWGIRQKISRGAANLRSAPGGRHPTYVTASAQIRADNV